MITATTSLNTAALTATGASALDGGITVDTTNFIVHGTTGAVTTASSVTAASAAIGGGYASTGCDIAATGALSCSGLLTGSAGATIGGLVTLTAASPATVTDGAAFAISGAWQPITAAGPVTPTITIPAAGVDACIENTAAQAITIVDTGNQVLTADAVLNQYDVLCGHSDGTRFIETSRANN